MKYFPFERNHYYYGKFLSADVLDAEQKYMNDKRRFLNRFLHGSGVIFGMSVLAADEKTIAVQPGAAIDFAGREIVIDQPMLLNIAALDGGSVDNRAAVLYLCLEYDEYPKQLQYLSESNGQYDFISEHYRFFITTHEPIRSIGTLKQFYMQEELVYSCEAYTVCQKMPVMAKVGEEVVLEVHIKRQIRECAVKFSYQVRLTGMKYKEERIITISYDSQMQPLSDDQAILKFPLHILLYADGEEAYAETVPGSFSGGYNQKQTGYSVCRMNTEIVMQDIQMHLLQRFRDEGMQQIIYDNVHQPPICLAAIHMRSEKEQSVIDHIERMPFAQYVSGNPESEIINFFEQKNQREHKQQIKNYNTSDEAEKLKGKYTIATGVAEIAMPMGGRAGQRFYSEPISHGLGIGRVSFTLGIISSDTETIYGDSQVFAETRQDICAKLAAKLNNDQGTFVIGVILTEPTAETKIKVHWTAIHNHTAEVTGNHPHMLIKPNLASLCVMENLTFEVQFEQMPKQSVQWSIAEGARGGVITEGGAYTAPNTPGVYQINVKAAESGMQASAFVSVRELH